MFDQARLVFTSTNIVRLRDRWRCGERLIGRVPQGHWKTIAFVAGLRHDKMVAPFVMDKPMTKATFLTYLQQCLRPTLPKYSPELNPIEQAFSKFNALLRKAAERTIPRLCRRIGKLLAAFSAREWANFFAHAGYASV